MGQRDANRNLVGGDFRMSTGFGTHSQVGYAVYLPIMLLRMSDAPDLIVESTNASPALPGLRPARP
jgi:hypothetical protein